MPIILSRAQPIAAALFGAAVGGVGRHVIFAAVAQIQPHFIFNTLSLITWKAYESEGTEVAKLTNAW